MFLSKYYSETKPSRSQSSRSAQRLGNVAKIASGLSGGSLTVPVSPSTYNHALQRQRRFKLQSTAARLLPDHRISFCLKRVSSASSGVSVLYSGSHGAAHFAGLQTCGSVWACPICAAKIAVRRRDEIKLGVDAAEAKGWRVLLLTLTVQHSVDQSLDVLLDGLKKAWREFWGGRAGGALRKRLGVHGHISSFEITHGANGWHPHMHILLLVDELPVEGAKFGSVRRSMASLSHDIRKHWLHLVERFGLRASYANGADLQAGGSHLAKYFTKLSEQWGIEHEMTSKSKLARSNAGRTPNDLLSAAADGDHEAAALYVQMVKATFGEHWVQWSRTLKKRLGLAELIKDKSDKELADEQSQDAVLVVQLLAHEWKQVFDQGLRSELLDVVEDSVQQNNLMKLYLYLFSSDIIDENRLDSFVRDMQ